MTMSNPTTPIRVYRNPLSGHCHRVELFLSLLGLPTELIDVNLKNGEQKTSAFVTKSPLGQVPVIEDGETVLADSNAILVYLALTYADESWLPRDAIGAAAVQRYLSIAAGEITYGPALARRIQLFKLPMDIQAATATSHRLFTSLNKQLTDTIYLIGSTPTIADLACYSYIAHAPEGGISLDEYVHLRRWLSQIEALPGFVAMQRM